MTAPSPELWTRWRRACADRHQLCVACRRCGAPLAGPVRPATAAPATVQNFSPYPWLPRHQYLSLGPSLALDPALHPPQLVTPPLRELLTVLADALGTDPDHRARGGILVNYQTDVYWAHLGFDEAQGCCGWHLRPRNTRCFRCQAVVASGNSDCLIQTPLICFLPDAVDARPGPILADATQEKVAARILASGPADALRFFSHLPVDLALAPPVITAARIALGPAMPRLQMFASADEGFSGWAFAWMPAMAVVDGTIQAEAHPVEGYRSGPGRELGRCGQQPTDGGVWRLVFHEQGPDPSRLTARWGFSSKASNGWGGRTADGQPDPKAQASLDWGYLQFFLSDAQAAGVVAALESPDWAAELGAFIEQNPLIDEWGDAIPTDALAALQDLLAFHRVAGPRAPTAPAAGP